MHPHGLFEIFSANLRRLRHAPGLSQEELACSIRRMQAARRRLNSRARLAHDYGQHAAPAARKPQVAGQREVDHSTGGGRQPTRRRRRAGRAAAGGRRKEARRVSLGGQDIDSGKINAVR